jgi:hypothetical protein
MSFHRLNLPLGLILHLRDVMVGGRASALQPPFWNGYNVCCSAGHEPNAGMSRTATLAPRGFRRRAEI